MSISVHNPYSGQDDETCSVSFSAQQKIVGGISSPQTEAQYSQSKILGEWGVIVAKLKREQIPDNTKLIAFESSKVRGYLLPWSQKQVKVVTYVDGKKNETKLAFSTVESAYLKNASFKKSIPGSAKPRAEKVIASPTPSPAVNAGSKSVGSMSDEDVSAMFVKIKDDLAKEKGLNIKGANPELDAVVYKAIGEKIGYTPDEVKAKIEAYKAAGNKLSALKKKVLLGTKKVPDPKPNEVPTKVTATVTNAAKEEVKKVAEAKPTKVYSDEDVAAQYIIAKDATVAASNGKWTLYTKSDELEAKIYAAIQDKTGLSTLQAKQAIANYLTSGKKLSSLKKQLAKQGAFEPKADTLKKSGAEKGLADKAKDVEQKADQGYTPTSTPAVQGVATGKPAPERVRKEDAQRGDIASIPDNKKQDIYKHFKGQYGTYLSSTEGQNYDAFATTQAHFKALGDDYSLLQLIRVVDEAGAKKFNTQNAKLFEKKVATWLTTPAGTNHIKANEAKLAAAAEKAAKAAELAKVAKELEANQPPLPPDSALFEPWSLEKAKRVSATWLEAKPWTARQKNDLKHYTGSSYTEMNGYLRGIRKDVSDRNKNAIEGARQGMRPTTEPVLVSRGTGLSQFKSLGVGTNDASLVWGLTGKTFKDEGFLSTSAGGKAAFGGQAILEIECPVGTPMAYVAPISKYPHENEMLLQAGIEYKILKVRQEGGRFIIRMRVVNWPGKAS